MSSKKIVSAIVNRPAISFILTFIIVCITAYWALNVTKNTTPYFLDPLHPERVKEDMMTDIFSRSKESIFVVLKQKNGDIFNQSAVAQLETIHATLEKLDLIELLQEDTGQVEKTPQDKAGLIERYNQQLRTIENEKDQKNLQQDLGQYLYPIRSIKSLLNSDDIFMEDDDITVSPNFGYDKLEAWQQNEGKEVLNNKLFVGSLLSKDASAMSIQLELNIDADNSDNTTAIFLKIKQAIESVLSEEFEVYFAGTPVVNVEISSIMEKDNQRYFPIIIMFISLILFAVFRSIWAPILALSVSIISIVITFGLMYLLGISLNIVTTILPIFVVTIGVTDAIHVLSETTNTAENNTKKQRIIANISKLFRPMLMTSITTALGFFSLSFTDITNIQDFGIMVALSTMIAFFVSVTFLPAAMTLVSYKKAKSKNYSAFLRMENLAQRQTPRRTILLIMVLALFAALGIPKFFVDQQNLNSFQAGSDIRQDDAMINSLLGGTIPVNVWIKSKANEGILDSNVLAVMEAIQAKALEHKHVGYTASLGDLIVQTNDVLFPENRDAKASSLDKALISQYLLLLEGGPSRELESLTNVGAYNQTRVLIMVKTDSSKILQALLDDLETVAATLPASSSYRFTGFGSMNAAAAKSVVNGQLSSIAISVIGLLLLTGIIYKSLIFGIIAIFPLCMSLALMFGLMGLLGIPLDIGSCLVCGVAFGIGIDYSIHIIEAFKRNVSNLGNLDAAIHQALKEVAFPIITSAITIALGFSILLISEFKPIANLGLLVSITMISSAVCALFIIPTLLSLAGKKLKLAGKELELNALEPEPEVSV